jgi:phthiocerol/phenolphthiocerol synthesis type-I polyketide synthase B
MARELLEREPVFRDAISECDRAARSVVSWSILDLLESAPEAAARRLEEIDVVQPVLLASSIAYAALWRSLGVEPAALVGHSMGEVGAAHLAGVLDLEAAMRIVCRRSALMKRLAGRGAMALVDLSAEDAATRIRGREEQIAVAVSNSPRSSVLSGDPAAVDAVLAELEREGVFCRRVKVDVASHSPQMAPLAAELAAELDGLAPRPTSVPLYSTVLARRVEGRELGADHWGRNLRQPVQFAKTISALLAEGITAFVELGPHPVLLPAVEQTAQAAGTAVATVASGRREEPEQAVLLAGLGRLWTAGGSLDWKRISPAGTYVSLPRYPWRRERHWVEGAEMVKGEGAGGARRERLDDRTRGWLYRLRWQARELPAAGGSGSWLVASADPASGDALARALREAGATAGSRTLDSLELAAKEPEVSTLVGLVVLAGAGEDAPFLPLRALQALLAAPEPRPRLWFVTRGAHAAAGPARVAVEHAALWGSARVVAEEHPEIWGGLVDLDPAIEPADPGQTAILARHLLAGDGEDGVALRGGERLVQRLVPSPDVASTPFVWRADRTYLVTGGLGEVPLEVARHLVSRGVRRLALLGRTPLPPRNEWAQLDRSTTEGRRTAAVQALEAAGAAVHVVHVDVTDEGQVRGFLDRWTAEGWPPIRGVLHAVGAFGNQLASTMDRTAFDAVVRPKLGGALLLDRLLPDLDLFVLFSSIGGFLAQPGQANYAAANAGLDAIATDRAARGHTALSVAWGVWDGIGLVRGEAGRTNVAEMSRQGIQPIAPNDAVSVLGWLCGCAAETMAVVPAEWTAFAKARGARMAALFRDLVGEFSDEADLATTLAAASPDERKKRVEPIIREAVGRTLKVAPERINRDRALGSMGLSSLLAMELRNRLETALGRSLPASLAFNYPTVAALVNHLSGHDAAKPAGEPEARAPRRDVEEIAGLSDEEAILALRSRRGLEKR